MAKAHAEKKMKKTRTVILISVRTKETAQEKERKLETPETPDQPEEVPDQTRRVPVENPEERVILIPEHPIPIPVIPVPAIIPGKIIQIQTKRAEKIEMDREGENLVPDPVVLDLGIPKVPIQEKRVLRQEKENLVRIQTRSHPKNPDRNMESRVKVPIPKIPTPTNPDPKIPGSDQTKERARPVDLVTPDPIPDPTIQRVLEQDHNPVARSHPGLALILAKIPERDHPKATVARNPKGNPNSVQILKTPEQKHQTRV